MLSRTLIRWNHAVLSTLQHENSDCPSKTTKSWEWSCSLCYYKHSASSLKSRGHIPDIDLIYRADFSSGNNTQIIAYL